MQNTRNIAANIACNYFRDGYTTQFSHCVQHGAQYCTVYMFTMEPLERHQSEPNMPNTRNIVRNIARKNLGSRYTSQFIYYA